MFVTLEQLDGIIDIPISCPITEIMAADWLVVSTIKIQAAEKLKYRYLSLQVVDASVDGVAVPLNDGCNPVTIKRINQSYGLAYVGIAKDYSPSEDPSTITWVGTAADVVSATSSGVYTRDLTATTLEIAEAGNYSFVLVNNCQIDAESGLTTNVDLRVVVSGSVRLEL